MKHRSRNTAEKEAVEYCREHGLSLTDPRLEVFRIIISSQKPMGAYEILEKLGTVIDNPKPPTVYRAIEFWRKNGFVHRIESLNAYIWCRSDHRHSGSQFIVCDNCHSVVEIHLCEIPSELKEKAVGTGYAVTSWAVELHGKCAACQ